MQSKITHTDITNLHRNIKRWHKDIKGFYRFNYTELANGLRSEVEAPVLLLESYSSQIKRNANQTTNFKGRNISFLLLDFAGAPDDYDKQEEVLSRLEEIGDDICSLLDKLRKDKEHWMYGLFDAGTFKMEKVGPLWDNMMGWNIMYDVDSRNPLTFEPDKWDFTTTE